MILVALGGFCYGAYFFSKGDPRWLAGGVGATVAQALSLLWLKRRKKGQRS